MVLGTGSFDVQAYSDLEAAQKRMGGPAVYALKQESWTAVRKMSQAVPPRLSSLQYQEKSLWLRTWLGDTKGAFIEWSSDGG